MINFVSLRSLLQTCIDWDCKIEFSFSPSSPGMLQVEFKWLETETKTAFHYLWHIDLWRLHDMPTNDIDAWLKRESNDILHKCAIERRLGKQHVPSDNQS